MFKDKIKPEATPERVYELCKIVASENSISNTKLREILEPAEFATNTVYYGTIKNAAVELGVIEENNEITFIQDKKIVKATPYNAANKFSQIKLNA